MASRSLGAYEKTLLRKIKHATELSGKSRFVRLVQSPIKSIVPVIMRKMGISYPLELNTFWGGKFASVLPEAVSTCIWRTGSFDESVSLTLLHYLPVGGVFLDIGAHFGFFSLFASSLAGSNGQVIAVEAIPSTFKQLKQNIEISSNHEKIYAVNVAAYNKQCNLEFSDFGVIASSLNSAFNVRQRNSLVKHTPVKISIEAKTVDAILEEIPVERLDVVKIDAESSELFVLQGMASSLSKFRPVVILEIGDYGVQGSYRSSEIVDLLKAIGYSAFEWNASQKLVELKLEEKFSYNNVVFLPCEPSALL